MFSAIEQAIKGSPVEFYYFQRGAIDWFYTSADNTIVYNGDSYAPTKLKRSRIRQGSGMSAEAVTMTLPRNDALAITYIDFPVAIETTLTIYAQHRNDNDNEVVHLWSGRVKNAKFAGAACELFCESILTATRAQGLKRTFCANCSHVLYGQTPLTCGVLKASYEVTATLDSVSGATITDTVFDGFTDGYFNGGIVEWDNAGVTEYRMILQHTGGNLRLVSPFVGIEAGASVKAYTGCNRTMTDCETKFGNLDNFGGWPFVPTDSPFGGKMIF